VEFEQLPTFPLELDDAMLLAPSLSLGFGSSLMQFVDQLRLEIGEHLLRHLYDGVMIGDLLFQNCDRASAQAANCSVLLPAETEVVRIDGVPAS
jgi:hypothetical protein